MTKEKVNAADLKKGSIIEILSQRAGGDVWVTKTIIRATKKYVWFGGSGYDRIAKNTFINWSSLYRIVSL